MRERFFASHRLIVGSSGQNTNPKLSHRTGRSGQHWPFEVLRVPFSSSGNATLPGCPAISCQGLEVAGLDGLANLSHQGLVVVQIVQCGEAMTEDLVALLQMLDISPGVIPTGIARAVLVDRPGVSFIPG